MFDSLRSDPTIFMMMILAFIQKMAGSLLNDPNINLVFLLLMKDSVNISYFYFFLEYLIICLYYSLTICLANNLTLEYFTY